VTLFVKIKQKIKPPTTTVFTVTDQYTVAVFVEALHIVSEVAEHANQSMKYLVST